MSSTFIPRFRLPVPAEPFVRRSGQFAVILVAAGACWLLAGLLWGFTHSTPGPVELPDRRPGPVGERLAGQLRFAGPAVAAVVPANLMLVGVSASADAGQARALIRREGESQLLVLAIGDEVSPGLRLTRIQVDRVQLSGPGGDSLLVLPKVDTAPPASSTND